MFHVNIFITNMCALVTGIIIEFPILIDVLSSLSDQVCETNLTVRRMFITITLTHFQFLAVNRAFAICFPNRKCLISKKAFAIKSITGYCLPIVWFAVGNFFIEMRGSQIIFNEELMSCIHVTLDDGAARYVALLRAIMPCNRNLPTHCHKISPRAFYFMHCWYGPLRMAHQAKNHMLWQHMEVGEAR